MRLRTLAQRNPDGLAVIDAAERFTFAKLFDKAEQLATNLGLEPDQAPVAFVAENDLPTIALIWALFDRDIPALPINPRLTAPEQHWLVRLAGARFLSRTDAGFVDDSAVRVPITAASDCTPTVCTPPKTQLLIATSGSSGTPKLVCLSREALCAAAMASVEHLRIDGNDRWLLSLSLAHIGGISILLRCLLAEASVVIGQPGLSAASITGLIGRSEATLTSVVPTQLERWLSLQPRPSMPSLRAILLGGAKTPTGMQQRARDAGWPVLTTYGLSEAGSQVTVQPLDDLESPDAYADAGVPVPGIEVKIEDGTICVRGGMLFDRYLPGQDSPFDREGWFKTGDLGRLTETGRLIPMGRRDDCIVTGGENVSALEVETAILARTTARSAVVVALDDEKWGQIVAAAVVLGQTDVDFSSFIREAEIELTRHLAPHKRPRRWLMLQQLPELPGGKVNRRAVAGLFGK